jgi:hypothetical protein
VENPPLLRPKASSSWFRSPLLHPPRRVYPLRRRRAVGANYGMVHAHFPFDLAHRVALGLRVLQ